MNEFAKRLLQREPWEGLMMGNHALVRAMLEAGVMSVSAYPGSPTPEIAHAIEAIPEDVRPLRWEWSTNEKVALEVGFGASINGHLSCVFFKSVGLNVALDSCQQLGLLDLTGGLVIILGDDPGANSSQNEQDNRHIARMAGIPMFEPGSPTEAYKMFLEAATLSQHHKMPVFLRMTTHVCHAREVISFGAIPEHALDWTPRFNPDGLEYWPITANVFPLKEAQLAKLNAVEQAANTSPSNELIRAGEGIKRGIITMAIPAYSVREVLEITDAKLDMLKLGITFPLPRELVLNFLKNHDEVLILEELDRVVEHEIKSLAYDEGLSVKLHNRSETSMLMREFTPDRTWDILHQTWPDLLPARQVIDLPDEAVSPRVAQMCPGCGHRSAFHAVRDLLQDEFPEAITVADIGCHSLGSMEPYNMGRVLLCMGHSNGTGAGLAIGNDDRPVITFIGDSTFFHAGLPGIINGIMHKHNLTLIVMENGTTAMTGHQPTAGSGELGNDRIDIPKVLKALGCEFVKSVSAYKQDDIKQAMRESIAHKGFSVVIAKHPCMLKFGREKVRRAAKREAGLVAK